jgi:hypothetical protein
MEGCAVKQTLLIACLFCISCAHTDTGIVRLAEVDAEALKDFSTNPTGTKEVISGVVRLGMEECVLIPDGTNEEWWLEGDGGLPEALKRAHGGSGRYSPYGEYRVKVFGFKSEPGKYGHLGSYDRAFYVLETLEVQLISKWK